MSNLISYLITACNEDIEFKKLFNLLEVSKRKEDNIVVLLDENKSPKGSEFNNFLLDLHKSRKIRLISDSFGGDFAEWKNKLKNHELNNDILFFLDADELPNPLLIEDLHIITELNPDIDCFILPRLNFVKDITPEHIKKWGWVVDNNNRINYPDYQKRIFRNKSQIRWRGRIHETVVGANSEVVLPEPYSILHTKDLKKQELQNNSYITQNYEY